MPRFEINQSLRLTKSEVIASHGGRRYTLESNNLVTFGGSFQRRRGVRTLWVMTDATLASATNNANKQLINTLLRSRLFRDYENVFTRATGLALALRPLEYWVLEPLQKAHENRFCALLSQRRATLAVCLQSHADIISHTGATPCTEICPFGLTETAVPVRLGEKTIGFLRIGQILRRSAIRSDKARVAARLRECGVPFTGSIRKAWKATPIIPKDQYSAIVQLLSFFAVQLSTFINQIVLEKQNCEPPLVRKARHYIEQHKMEPISLATIARVSGANVSYFCKVFKKTTGLTFTEYLGRVRLEDAKAQLLNPNRRIGEIAYDVGFQSLTQFNRMFKRVFGQSPTEFRVHLGRKQYRFAGRRVGSGWDLICLLLVGIRVSAEAAFNLEIGLDLLC